MALLSDGVAGGRQEISICSEGALRLPWTPGRPFRPPSPIRHRQGEISQCISPPIGINIAPYQRLLWISPEAGVKITRLERNGGSG